MAFNSSFYLTLYRTSSSTGVYRVVAFTLVDRGSSCGELSFSSDTGGKIAFTGDSCSNYFILDCARSAQI
jgi:hypothetical protein